MVFRFPRLAGAALACLLCTAALGCTSGTTPDCADAQCRLVSVVEGGEDAASGDAAEDTGSDTQVPEAAPEAAPSVSDAGTSD